MKNLISFLFFAIILLQSNQLKACTCFKYSFCESTSNISSVVEVEVIKKYADSSSTIDTYADVKIIGTLQNEINQDTITISGFLFTTCDEHLPNMDIGDTLLLNFQGLISSYQEAKYPAIQLDICSTRILKLSSGIVTGNIQPNLNSITYSDLTINLDECVNFVSSTDDLNYLEKEISISPNPFSENIKIDFGNLTTSKISLEIFSAQSQKITSAQNFQQYNYKLSMKDFPKGIYFVKIQYKNESIVKKIVKM